MLRKETIRIKKCKRKSRQWWNNGWWKLQPWQLTTSPLAPEAPTAPAGPGIPRGPGRPGAPATPGRPCEGKCRVVDPKATTGEAALIPPPSIPQQHVSHSHHILTAAPLAPVRPLAPGLPYEEKEGRKIPVNRNISLLPWLHHHSFGFFVFFHSVRLMTRATYRRSNGARKTWKTHFTTGTRGTSRARVTNRSNFTLKEGMTLGR